MLDPSTLSASQKLRPHSSVGSLRETDKIPIVIPDLSASGGNWRKSEPGLQETIQEGMKIASSIELPNLSVTRYVGREKEAISFFQFISQLQMLEQKYTLRERDETVRVLEKNLPLSFFLLEIYKQILSYFPAARFYLKAIADPEAEDNNEGFVVSIVTSLQPRKALEKLEKFYENWWFTIPAQSGREKISFNLECV